MARNALDADELEAMRERMAEAAMGLYRSGGLAAVSFRKLADALGCSHMQPYRCFDSKDALMARLRSDGFARLGKALMASVLASGDAVASSQRLIAMLAGYIAFARQDPDQYLLLFSTDQPSPLQFPVLLAARRDAFELAVDAVQRCVDDGCLRGDARLLTHQVWIGLHGLLSLHTANQLVHGFGVADLAVPLLHALLGEAGLSREAWENGLRELRRKDRSVVGEPVPVSQMRGKTTLRRVS